VGGSGKECDARDSVMRVMFTVPGIRWAVQVRDVMQETVGDSVVRVMFTVPDIRWAVQVRDVMQEIVS
jgi:hypothetical protein